MSSFCERLWRVIARMMVSVGLLLCPLASAVETALPPARDLSADAKIAMQDGMPVIVLVSLAGCGHCEVVRRSHLLPLLRDATAAKPVIRQVEVRGGETLRDFDGKQITHAEFARRHKVRIAPVVFFFDGKGTQLTAPLVGSMIPDFYGAYFDTALDEAKSKLRGRATGN